MRRLETHWPTFGVPEKRRGGATKGHPACSSVFAASRWRGPACLSIFRRCRQHHRGECRDSVSKQNAVHMSSREAQKDQALQSPECVKAEPEAAPQPQVDVASKPGHDAPESGVEQRSPSQGLAPSPSSISGDHRISWKAALATDTAQHVGRVSRSGGVSGTEAQRRRRRKQAQPRKAVDPFEDPFLNTCAPLLLLNDVGCIQATCSVYVEFLMGEW